METEAQVKSTSNGTIRRTADAKALTPEQAVALAEQMGFTIDHGFKDITNSVERSDVRKITIPRSMSKLDAAKELENQWKNEEQVIDVTASFENWDWKDVLVAIKYITEDTFGWIRGQATFFGNPTEIDVVTNIKAGTVETTKAFYGNFKVGAWENCGCGIGIRRGVVSIVINCKKKFSEEVTQYFNLIRKRLSEASIYRGKTVVVTKDPAGELAFDIIENKSADHIVLNEDEDLVVQNFILNSLSEPGKRSYLLTGNYGNGKTETAMRIGREAITKYGQSFFYLKDSTAFDLLLERAKNYQPCIVFVEDIDEITAGEKRDSSMNKILNTLDGVQTKGNNLTVIFTTNHANRINTALRRPGRIDIVLEFKNPNKDTVKKIMQNYFVNIPGCEALDYEVILAKFPDVQGAVVAEVCKRAVKLYKNSHEFDTKTVLASLASMSYQIELMNDTPDKVTDEVKFVGLYKKLLLTDQIAGIATLTANLPTIGGKVDQIHKAVC